MLVFHLPGPACRVGYPGPGTYWLSLEWRLLQLALSFWLQAQQTAFIPYQTMTSPHNMTAAVCTVALSLEMIPDSLNTATKTKAITIAFMACNYAHFAGLSKVSRTSFYTSAYSVAVTGPPVPALSGGRSRRQSMIHLFQKPMV